MMRALLALVATLLFAGPAQAQPAPWQPERVTAGWVFTPSIAFGTMWDTNVTIANEGSEPTGEMVGVLNPRGEIDYNGRRAKFNLGYSGSLEAYRNLDELTRYEQRGRMESRYQMTRRLQLRTRSELTLSPTTDQIEIGGLPFVRVGSRYLTAGGGFIADLSPRAQLRGEYEFDWIRFERDPRFALLQGGHSHSPIAEFTYALSSRLKVGGHWDYRHAIVGGGAQISDTQNALGIVEYQVGRYTTVAGGAGLAYLHLSNTGETQTGPSLRASVAHKAGRTLLSAGFERSFIPSFGFGGMTANQVIEGRATVPLAEGRVVWSSAIAHRRSEPILSQGLNIQLDSVWASTTVGFYVARWLRMDGFYTGTFQNSSAQGNVDRARIGIQFVTFKPVRIQ